jgi:Leucine-rich repeat (LRR) protein
MKRWHVLFLASPFILVVACSPKLSFNERSIIIERTGLVVLPDSVCTHNEAIKSLLLSNNQLEKLPFCLKNYSELERLDLSNNRFEKVPPVVLKLKSLKYLSFSRNPIKTLPDSLQHLESLEQLDLWQTDLRELPLYLIQMKQLKEIDVRNTFMKSEDLEWLKEARPDLIIKSSYGCDCD